MSVLRCIPTFLAIILAIFSMSTRACSQEAAPKDFEFLVVGPAGEVVPQANVEIRSNQKTWDLLAGKQTRQGTYGVFVQTDNKGRLAFRLPKTELNYLNLSIEAKGYGLFWAGWSFSQKSEKLPTSYTANLDVGQSFGGIVLDPEGMPVAGAQVHPSIEYKKREGDLSQLGSGKSYKTDDQGKWRVDTVPGMETSLRVQVTHADFMPTRLTLPIGEYGLKFEEPPHKAMVLERGLTVTGAVTDQTDQPIPGAIVRAEIQNQTLEAHTDQAGRFALKNCQPGTFEIVVTAPTYAPDLKQIDIRDGLPDVDFKLEPGKTIRVLVTDKDGKPVPKSRIFFQHWRGDSHAVELGKMLTYTDDQGVWEWDSAPTDAIVADICPANGMQIPNQTLIGGQEYSFVSTPELKVVGRIVDAETGEPIQQFRVVPGTRWPGREQVFWQVHESFDGADGQFAYTESRLEGGLLMRIEAAGYAPLTSRDIAWNEEIVKLKYALKKAEDVSFRVLTPAGQPAKSAKVALAIAGSQVMLRNGQFTSQTYATQGTTDADGRVSFRPQARAFKLFVTHASGYGEVVVEPPQLLQEIQLQAWARVEGKLQIGVEVGSKVDLVLYSDSHHQSEELPNAMHQYSASTDEQGRFLFSRVLPGNVRIGREIITHRTQSGYRTGFSHAARLLVEAGQTHTVELGGAGIAIEGLLIAPQELSEPVDWNFTAIEIQQDIGLPPPLPFPEGMAEGDKGAWFQKWLTTPGGIDWRIASDLYQERSLNRGRFIGAVDEKGYFRIADLPPGNYTFSMELHRTGTGTHGDRDKMVGKLEFPFELPASSQAHQVVNLGSLQVKATESQ